MVKISVVIPTYNRKNLLYDTLIQLRGQLAKTEDLFCNIIVVVDGSTDGTLEMLEKEFSEVNVVLGTGEWWYTKSMNEGFKFAKKFNPDYVLALNDDIILGKVYLKELIKAIKKVPVNSIIGSFSYIDSMPPQVFFSGISLINKITYKQYKYLKPLSEINLSELSGIKKSKTLPGRGMLIPFKVLKDLNYFDEKFPQYASDDDFVLRAQKAGYIAYVSFDARIISMPEHTSKGSPLNKTSFPVFFKNMMFNKYSSTYYLNTVRIIYRHGNRFFLPFTLLYQFMATIYSYFKYL